MNSTDRSSAPTELPTQYLDVAGGRLAYDDTGGTGPVVVAIPGIGDSRRSYRHLTPMLVDAGLRVVTVDLRGLGESSAGWTDYSDLAVARDVLAVIDALRIDRAVLIGNSLGAAAAVLAATDAPERVAGLVLVGPFARAVPMAWWQKAAFRALLAPPWGRRAWVGYHASKMFPGPKPADHDAYSAQLAAMLREPGRMRAVRGLAANTHAESGERLGGVAVPTLVVMGSADPDFADPAGEAAVIAAHTRGEVLLVEGSGHYPQADRPDAVAPALVALVRQAFA